ncbi:MAG: Uma2 family endonuclease, partial [Bacteroidota bacterium]
MEALVLKSIDSFTDEQFFEFCRVNDELRIERDACGNIIIMEPTGGDTGYFNLEVSSELRNWNKENEEGRTFDSSTGFTLPDNSVLSPDATWIELERWKSLPKEERKRFAHISPDFVLEIRSENDNLKTLQKKMTKYIENHVRLAWLIDPLEEQVYIYRANGEMEHINSFDTLLTGEDVLKGFQIKL